MKKFLGFTTIILSLFVFAKSTSAQSYTAYLSSAQEVPTNASTGTGKARIVIDPIALMVTYNITFTGLSSNQTAGHIHGPAAIGANSGVQIGFTAVGGTSGTISGTSAITATQIAQIRSGMGYVNIHTTNFAGGEIRGQLAKNRPVDFDSDGRTDFSLLRFPTGPPQPVTFWNLRSTDGSAAAVWGEASTDFPAPGDYDGDGKDDLAVFRNSGVAGADTFFLVFRSATSTFLGVRWGVTGDAAVARDYDGDGITDMAVFRNGAAAGAPAFWYIRQSSAGFVQRSVQWGTTGDLVNNYDTPVPGDYDGDGKFDIAVYRFALTPANTFIILRSSDGTGQFVQWGNFNTDYILPGDYDGDGKFDFCAGRTGAASTSPLTWQILRSSDGAQSFRVFGISSDLPTQGDYDGDGRTDLSVYRRGVLATDQSTFYYITSLDNTPRQTIWGLRPDFPVNTFDAR